MGILQGKSVRLKGFDVDLWQVCSVVGTLFLSVCLNCYRQSRVKGSMSYIHNLGMSHLQQLQPMQSIFYVNIRENDKSKALRRQKLHEYTLIQRRLLLASVRWHCRLATCRALKDQKL